jgi:hypothetical protein
MKIELTVQEANALLALLDLAVKSGGLRVAADALMVTQKIQQAETENRQTEIIQ